MKSKIALLMSVVAAVFIGGCGPSRDLTVEQRRSRIDEMRIASLNEFYEEMPNGRRIIEKADGYGVFSNINVHVIFLSGSGGYGMVVNNQTGEKTYMKMGEAGIGFGLGAKDFRAIIVFHDRQTLNEFVTSGWEFGAEADAALKSDDKGGSAEAAGTLKSGMSIYQFTKTGIALQATLSGTKYWKDKELN
jgi:lipid-binding SYLF domain-containing protein